MGCRPSVLDKCRRGVDDHQGTVILRRPDGGGWLAAAADGRAVAGPEQRPGRWQRQSRPGRRAHPGVADLDCGGPRTGGAPQQQDQSRSEWAVGGDPGGRDLVREQVMHRERGKNSHEARKDRKHPHRRPRTQGRKTWTPNGVKRWCSPRCSDCPTPRWPKSADARSAPCAPASPAPATTCYAPTASVKPGRAEPPPDRQLSTCRACWHRAGLG